MIPQKTRSRLKVESYLSILQPFTIKDEVSIWRIVLVQEMKQQTSKRASIELSNKIERFLIPGARIIDYAKVVVEAYLKYIQGSILLRSLIALTTEPIMALSPNVGRTYRYLN